MLQLPPPLIKSLKVFTLAALLLFIILIFFHTDMAITQDLGRHLSLGKIIREKRIIPAANYFSYTYPEFPVLNHHWSSQVIFYLLHQAVNIEGLILIKVMLLVITYCLLVIFTLIQIYKIIIHFFLHNLNTKNK